MHASSSLKDTNQGPLTRSCAKKLQEQVNSFLTECNFNTYENVILPKCHILMMLRFTHEDVEGTRPDGSRHGATKQLHQKSNTGGQSDPGKSNTVGK